MTRRKDAPEAAPEAAGAPETGPEPPEGPETDATPADVKALLLRIRPAHVDVLLSDGSKEGVSVRGNRRKFHDAATTIEGLDWRTLYLRDEEGGLLYPPVDADRPPEPAKVDPADSLLVDGKPELRALGMILKAQSTRDAHDEKMIGPVLLSYQTIIKELVARNSELERRIGRAIALGAEGAEQIAAAKVRATLRPDGDGEDESGGADAVFGRVAGAFAHGAGIGVGKELAPVVQNIAKRFLGSGEAAPAAPEPKPDAGGEPA